MKRSVVDNTLETTELRKDLKKLLELIYIVMKKQ